MRSCVGPALRSLASGRSVTAIGGLHQQPPRCPRETRSLCFQARVELDHHRCAMIDHHRCAMISPLSGGALSIIFHARGGARSVASYGVCASIYAFDRVVSTISVADEIMKSTREEYGGISTRTAAMFNSISFGRETSPRRHEISGAFVPAGGTKLRQRNTLLGY